MQNTNTTMMKTTLQKLTEFVNRRPGLEYENYQDLRSYRAESREITADRRDYFELLAFAAVEVPDLDARAKKYLENSGSRLTLNKAGNIEYCTGQYFPTKYRPAACRVLSSIIWTEIRDRYPNYTGHDIRKYFRRVFSRRVARNYFS